MYVLTSSEADLLEVVDDGVLGELLPALARVRVHRVALTPAVHVVWNITKKWFIMFRLCSIS
jgi:hypothetical protein